MTMYLTDHSRPARSPGAGNGVHDERAIPIATPSARDRSSELLAIAQELARTPIRRRRYDAKAIAAERARLDAEEAGRIGAAKAAAHAKWMADRIAIYKKGLPR